MLHEENQQGQIHILKLRTSPHDSKEAAQLGSSITRGTGEELLEVRKIVI
jgi:hypothetical protein